ncbi:7tm Chemosensory receptor [Nesidiocoris tenuis]|uniref:7tm Chemosensory receptor n=1 Tax=Nesidiocoris tenuis TaxID=355587 RepID=A0ABN7AF59_9HEMI|nr:7tm Chemosensory receptor [Nesidiocoris tenuis]
MGVSMLVICLSNSACFVVAAYGFMSASIEKDYKSILHHLTNLVAGLAFLLVGCESAYRSSKKMGDNIIAALSVIDVANLSDPASREVNMFLQTVSLNPPVTMCAGIITLGRSFLTTTFSSTITYLIVLVQFKISDTEHAQINKTQIELRERWTMVQNFAPKNMNESNTEKPSIVVICPEEIRTNFVFTMALNMSKEGIRCSIFSIGSFDGSKLRKEFCSTPPEILERLEIRWCG